MRIALAVTYRAPRDHAEAEVYRAAAEETLARVIGREVLKSVKIEHRVSPGEARLPSHMSLASLDYVAEASCYVMTEEDLAEFVKQH